MFHVFVRTSGAWVSDCAYDDAAPAVRWFEQATGAPLGVELEQIARELVAGTVYERESPNPAQSFLLAHSSSPWFPR